MSSYEQIRESYQPKEIKWLFIAESPPPEEPKQSTRYFYKSGVGEGDRLFSNTMRALYPEAKALSDVQLEDDKNRWLEQFQADGCYLIEAVPESIPHGVKTPIRRQKIQENLPGLIERLNKLVSPSTKIILIKSNVFNVASEPLKAAGFHILNHELLDYPGAWREFAFQAKLTKLMSDNGWTS